MTKRLILMRHAKSDWDDPLLGDHDRQLNGRGRVSAQAVGSWLKAKKITPDQGLISSATRTRETFARLGITCDAAFLNDLYLAGAQQMLTTLKGAHGACVLMLGHNPGIAEFAEGLLAHPPEHARFFDFPTCATLVADFEIDSWADLSPGTGTTREFVIPRELTG